MKKSVRISLLALCGALVIGLAACGPKEPAATPAPSETPESQVTESVKPTETPETTPEATPEAEDTASPEPSQVPEPQAPVESAPAETPEPSAQPEPSQAPDEGSKVQAVWDAIATRELPFFMDLDADLLLQIYGIDAADLVEYVGKMPVMNTQATEFFIAQVQPGRMDTVKAALESRQDDLEEQWKQYLPDQLELVQNYKLVVNGDYILFAIADCADEAVEEFDTYTK